MRGVDEPPGMGGGGWGNIHLNSEREKERDVGGRGRGRGKEGEGQEGPPTQRTSGYGSSIQMNSRSWIPGKSLGV